MSSKKVLFTSHTANFSKFNRPFMRWFKEQSYEIHYASAGEEEVLDCDKHFTVPFSRNPLKISNVEALRQLKKILSENKYDIIHTHTPVGSVITRLAARKARKNGTRVIYTAHGFHFFKGAPILNWLTYYPIEKIMANYTDTLITINKEDYELAKSKFNTDVRYVAGVGIDQEKFDTVLQPKEKLEKRASLGLNKNDFVILYLAELSKRKNQLWLIRSIAGALRDNPDIHLLLAGQDSLKGECQKLTKELDLESSIHFLGYRKDVVELLNIADLAVSSSLQEGLPVNIMEAMYIGLPIVAVDCRGSRDLIKNDANGFIIERDRSQEFAERLLYLKEKENLRNAIANKNKLSISPYQLKEIIPNMAHIYQIGMSDE